LARSGLQSCEVYAVAENQSKRFQGHQRLFPSASAGGPKLVCVVIFLIFVDISTSFRFNSGVRGAKAREKEKGMRERAPQ